jgi:hypothetical protein
MANSNLFETLMISDWYVYSSNKIQKNQRKCSKIYGTASNELVTGKQNPRKWFHVATVSTNIVRLLYNQKGHLPCQKRVIYSFLTLGLCKLHMTFSQKTNLQRKLLFFCQ